MTLTGHRVESSRVELLDYRDTVIGDVTGVAACTLEWNAEAPITATGTIDLVGGSEIDFSSNRVRPYKIVDGVEYPLGVFVMASPGLAYRATGTARDVSLIDKLTVVRDDRITATLEVPAGENIVAAARAQVLATGEKRVVATQSPKTLTTSMVWDPGTSRLQVVNDLLAAADYWSLSTDNMGQFVIAPYTAPADRPIDWEFKEGDEAIHSPEWTFELPLWEATNHVTVISQEQPNGGVWRATARDDNPDSPTSTVRMRRTLNPIVEEGVEAVSYQDLLAKARRKLVENSNVVGVISVAHAFVPLWPRSGVEFTSQGFTARATVATMKVDLKPGTLVESVWKQAS